MLPNGPYKPNQTEEKILDFWLKNNFYKPEYNAATGKLDNAISESAETYTIIMPPPNANGNLHLGHVSGYSYQDLMGRYQRMQGKRVLLLPGKDHAGIQTEVVYERELAKKGLTKQDLGREEFYNQVYDFCIQASQNAREQEQRIGTSADFDRELFTLDPKIVDDVLQTFIMMHEEGLIYRGKRLINWCPRCQSALADIDTEYKDSKMNFFYFKYAFTEPEEKALELKNKYAGKEVYWNVGKYPATDEGNENYLVGTLNSGKVGVIGLGYDKVPVGTEVNGQVIGIQMRLDKNFHLVVASLDFLKEEDNDIDHQIEHAFLDLIGKVGGSHIIKFDEYKEDKFYTNGFVLGTVRPETKFGDTALAVSPGDARYAEFVNKSFEVQTLTGPRQIRIIEDEAVEADFGAGILKVTPAHAPEDWDIAQRHPEHTMPEKQVIGFDGKLNHLTGKYEGLSVNETRRQMVDDMREIGMLVHLDENYENRTQICERCKSRIEPLISHQWFVDTTSLKAKAKALVEDGHTTIMPEGRESVYKQWMDSKEDWCITRQLWWGYRIPVWYLGGKSEHVTDTGEVREMIGDKVMESPADYADLMKVSINHPQATVIDFIRHAESEENKSAVISGQSDAAITAEGMQKAKQVEFAHKYDAIIASPLNRAQQTAEIIAKKLGMDFATSQLIPEQDYGSLNGRLETEVMAEFGEEFDNSKDQLLRHADKWGGESDEDVQRRAQEFLDFVREEYAGQRVLVVTHSRFMKSLFRLQGREIAHPENLETQSLAMAPDATEWEQDPDVLDTWFSSGQWPFVTLNAREGDLQSFYPTNTMETGWDILIFWVTRMMMLSTYRAEKSGYTDGAEAPFSNVYLHGLVLDKNGAKMSKSKGNGIDPAEMISKYGADALRFSFIAGGAAGQNMRLSEEKVAANGRFMNKIWNASKFVMMNLEGVDVELATKLSAQDLTIETNIALWEHITNLKQDITRLYDSFQFGVAGQLLFENFWHEFADIHIEAAKPYIKQYIDRKSGEIIYDPSPEAIAETQKVMWYTLHEYLKMLHPIIPFITEEIWQHMAKPKSAPKSLMYVSWD